MIKTKIPNSVDTDIRFAGTRDMLQVYDPYKKQWLDWKRTGKVILPSTITVTTSTLDGEPVTCQINNESYTTQFISGVAVFKVYSLGTATITCGTYSTTVNVDTDSGEYGASLESEIVLWNGTSAQNGAEKTNTSVSFHASSGDFVGKSINFKCHTTGSLEPSLDLYVNSASTGNIRWLCPNGTIASGGHWNDTFYFSEVYSYSFSAIAASFGVSESDISGFRFTNRDHNNLVTEYDSYFGKFWLR